MLTNRQVATYISLCSKLPQRLQDIVIINDSNTKELIEEIPEMPNFAP